MIALPWRIPFLYMRDITPPAEFQSAKVSTVLDTLYNRRTLCILGSCRFYISSICENLWNGNRRDRLVGKWNWN